MNDKKHITNELVGKCPEGPTQSTCVATSKQSASPRDAEDILVKIKTGALTVHADVLSSRKKQLQIQSSTSTIKRNARARGIRGMDEEWSPTCETNFTHKEGDKKFFHQPRLRSWTPQAPGHLRLHLTRHLLRILKVLPCKIWLYIYMYV